MIAKPDETLSFAQISILVAVQILESVNINMLFPFLAFMVEDFGHGGAQLGVYAGMLAATFCGAQLCSSVPWGMASDAYGRRPAIIVGTFGAGLGMLVFGLSGSFPQAVLGRAISGLLSGNLGVVKCYLTEITTEANRGLAFSYMSLGTSIGTVVGPLLGGLLCRPALKYPQYFSTTGPFGVRPYLLPCLVCVAMNLGAAALCCCYMKESRVFPDQAARGGKGRQREGTGGGAVELAMLPARISTAEADAAGLGTPFGDGSSTGGSAGSHSNSTAAYTPLRQRDNVADFEADGEELDTDSSGAGAGMAPGDTDVGGSPASVSTSVSVGQLEGDSSVSPLLPPKQEPEEESANSQDGAHCRNQHRVGHPGGEDEEEDEEEDEDEDEDEEEDEELVSCDCLSGWLARPSSSGTALDLTRSPILFKPPQPPGGSLVESNDSDNESHSSVSETELRELDGVDVEAGGVSMGRTDEVQDVELGARRRSLSNQREGGSGSSDLESLNGAANADAGGNRKSSHRVRRKKPPVPVLQQRSVLMVTANYGLLGMAAILLDETIPLMLKLDTGRGGFSFNSSQIGVLLSCSGAFMVVFTTVILPWLTKQSKRWLNSFGTLACIPCALLWPLVATLNHTVVTQSHRPFRLLWPLLIVIYICKSTLMTIAFTGLLMQVNHSVYPEHLGKVNGLGQSFVSLARAIGPAIGGCLWSLSTHIHFVFLNFIVVSVLYVCSDRLNAALPARLESQKVRKKHKKTLGP